MSTGPVGLGYRHRGAFWLGILACTGGVVLHLPMYAGSADHGYHMAGMHPDGWMTAGMLLIVGGLGLAGYGLLPRRRPPSGTSVPKVRALDDAPMRASHVGLLLVMAAAVTIDVMKPTTLAFVAPGMAREYGLKSPVNPGGDVPVALLPLSGILGTVIGSLLWGWLGDRIGRRASILLAGVLFITTAVCGTMPSFELNLVMCFVMGIGVGGMLPITFTLLAETMPARHRGWLMVLIGGDVAGAYLITSWLSAELVPEYGWRVLWLVGLPTGVLLILLNRWIPESPRFLLLNGLHAEAAAVMRRYGARVVPVDESEVERPEVARGGGFRSLFERPVGPLTASLTVLALAVGFISFGFQLWLPSNLQRLGFSGATADLMLRDSALYGLPLIFVVAALYGLWSSKKVILAVTALMLVALVGFVVAGDDIVRMPLLLNALLVMPTVGVSVLVALLAAYSVEIYPTHVRSRGAGLNAATTKAAGVLVIALVAVAAVPPGIWMFALLGVFALGAALVALAVTAVETRSRNLEEIAS